MSRYSGIDGGFQLWDAESSHTFEAKYISAADCPTRTPTITINVLERTEKELSPRHSEEVMVDHIYYLSEREAQHLRRFLNEVLPSAE